MSTDHYSKQSECLAAGLAANLQTPTMQAAELAKKIKPRSRRARRILEKREPKLVRFGLAHALAFCGSFLHSARFWLRAASAICVLSKTCLKSALLGLQVEDLKKTLLLHGGNVSQVVKDVLSDFRKLKGVRAQQPCRDKEALWRRCFLLGCLAVYLSVNQVAILSLFVCLRSCGHITRLCSLLH